MGDTCNCFLLRQTVDLSGPAQNGSCSPRSPVKVPHMTAYLTVEFSPCKAGILSLSAWTSSQICGASPRRLEPLDLLQSLLDLANGLHESALQRWPGWSAVLLGCSFNWKSFLWCSKRRGWVKKPELPVWCIIPWRCALYFTGMHTAPFLSPVPPPSSFPARCFSPYSFKGCFPLGTHSRISLTAFSGMMCLLLNMDRIRLSVI